MTKIANSAPAQLLVIIPSLVLTQQSAVSTQRSQSVPLLKKFALNDCLSSMIINKPPITNKHVGSKTHFTNFCFNYRSLYKFPLDFFIALTSIFFLSPFLLFYCEFESEGEYEFARRYVYSRIGWWLSS